MHPISTQQSHHQQLDQIFQAAVQTVHTQKDYRSAIAQLETAARAGYTKAALFLSQLYVQGFRVERDLYKAQYWQGLARQTA